MDESLPATRLLAELALELVQAAHVSASEAVNEWHIAPEPYELCDDIAGGIAIRHRPFNAKLPGTYSSQAEARMALARFYLLGRTTSSCVDREVATELGQWVGYALLRRNALLDDALSFGRAALLHDSSITRLAGRTAEAMRFLAKAREATDLRGAPIHTMKDFMGIWRKFSVNPQMVVQSLSSLEDAPQQQAAAADRDTKE